MKNRIVVTNWILFSVFVVLTVLFVVWQASDEMMFINESVAMILLTLGFPLKIYRLRIASGIVFFLLIILLFQLIGFSYTITEGNTTITHNSARFNSIVSPIVFIILILYIAFNYVSLIDLYHLLKRGSRKEQEDKRNKEMAFYYDMFKACTDNELYDIFKMYSDYPIEAQKALSKIRSEKGLK